MSILPTLVLGSSAGNAKYSGSQKRATRPSRNARNSAAAELRAFLEGRVARFWLPEYFAFPAELPKTSVGKIDKKEIRRLHAAGVYEVEKLGGKVGSKAE